MVDFYNLEVNHKWVNLMAKKKYHLMGQTVSLDKLPKGYIGKVIQIATPDQKLKRRLMDMGITEGVQVSIKKIAPLGDPIDITLRGYELCLRKVDLSFIDVEVIR